jgi:tryptophan-rich sensory protein
MEKKLRILLIAVAIPLLVGAVAGLLTRNSMQVFEGLQQPPFAPPGVLFPIVWTILYALMGIASYLIYTSGKDPEEVSSALAVYGVQLVVNFLWPIVFFRFGWYTFAFFWLILLWVLVIYTILLFYRISKPAAWLMVPYLIWLTYAAYLNLGIVLLN